MPGLRWSEEQFQAHMESRAVKKVSKEGNKKIVVDGIKFDSKIEAARYHELKLMEKAGLITNLQVQVKFELAPAVRILDRMRPPLRYIADFTYNNPEYVVEDVKGKPMPTDTFRIKRHLMKSVHGLDIYEYRKPSRKR